LMLLRCDKSDKFAASYTVNPVSYRAGFYCHLLSVFPRCEKSPRTRCCSRSGDSRCVL